MNVLGNSRWEPFATSTPLKPDFLKRVTQNGTSTVKPTIFGEEGISKESDFSRILQNKQSVKSKIKITGKNRSRAYFDLSLSSDDDGEVNDRPVEKKSRPVIKIGTENSDRSNLVVLNEKLGEGVKGDNKIKLCSAKCQKTRRKIPQKFEIKECVTSSLRLRNRVTNSQSTLHHVSPEQEKVTTSKCFQNKKEEKLVIDSKDKKPVLGVSNENHQIRYGKRVLKGKNGDNQNSVGFKKRRQAEVNKSLLVLKEKLSRNSSHQLFTDSTQEELINSLCLITSEEGEELDMKLSQKLKRRTVSTTKENDDGGGKVEKEERPKRTRQAPKKYWLVDEKPNPVKDKGEKDLKKKGVTKCTSSVPDLLSHPSDDVARMKRQLDLGEEKDEVFLKVTKPETHPEHPVFLPLSQVSYLENEFGHQVSQVCSMKNFKCGMFKLKPGSNFTWEKSQRRNHMGGVLVKGEMKMTIGGRERVLKEGDMALVPPLSECQASNTGGCDSLFYYWCGRFSK